MTDNKKHYRYPALTGLSAIALGMLPNIIDMDFFLTLIKDWPKTVFFIIVLMAAVILFLLSVTVHPDKAAARNDKSAGKWKHSILICDDKQSDLVSITDEMAGYDYDFVTLRDISDYRLANSFEIIVSDIFGIGATHKNAVSVLNTIKEKYPYKIVIAISNIKNSNADLRKDIFFIEKDREKQYVKKIRQYIKDAFAKLDNPEQHWQDTEAALRTDLMDNETINRHKTAYYNMVREAGKR